MIENKTLNATQLSDIALDGLKEIKGREIVRMDLRNTDGAIADYFVVCTGTSDKHVQSLADSVLKFTKEQAGERPFSVEGMQTGEWVLLDFINVVVHVFQKEKREFFRLEELWGDAEFEEIED